MVNAQRGQITGVEKDTALKKKEVAGALVAQSVPKVACGLGTARWRWAAGKCRLQSICWAGGGCLSIRLEANIESAWRRQNDEGAGAQTA